jgi:hypothetical protein
MRKGSAEQPDEAFRLDWVVVGLLVLAIVIVGFFTHEWWWPD